MSAVTTAIVAQNLKQKLNPEYCDIQLDGNLICHPMDDSSDVPVTVKVDGEKPTGGSITFENGKITAIDITMKDGNTYVLDEKGNVAEKTYIYRNSTEILYVGDSIDKISTYETNLSNISQNNYLKL